MAAIIYTALAIFGITTIMGMYLSSLVLRNKQTPKAIILVHGLFTISGFIALAYGYPDTLYSILFLSIATISGLILLYQDLTGKPFYKWLCFVHGFLTVIGMFCLTLPTP